VKWRGYEAVVAGVGLSAIALFIAYTLQLGDPVHRVLGFIALTPVAVYGVMVFRRRAENKSSKISTALFLVFICSLASVYALAWLRPSLYDAAAAQYPRSTAYTFVVKSENFLLAVTSCLYAGLLVLALYESVHRFISRKSTDVE
jgi:FtsH-binding integral membrane protein